MNQAEPEKLRRWPGVIFSLIIPGFGLVRAGKAREAVVWFFGYQVFGVFAILLFAAEAVPIVVGVGLCATSLIFQIWISVISFRPGRMTGKMWLVFLSALLVILVSPLPAHFFARSFKIPTSSMSPTFFGQNDEGPSDHILVNKFSYWFSEPERGDVIAFRIKKGVLPEFDHHPPRETIFMKRIIGLPEEELEIKEGAVFINGKRLGPNDGVPPVYYTDLKEFTKTHVTLEAEEFFLMGDNTDNSYDSRSWGAVPAEDIVGKITKIYYPFSRMGVPKFPDLGNKSDKH